MKILLLILSVLFSILTVDQSATPTPQPILHNATDSPSLSEYREILNTERKLLEEQSEKYLTRIDALMNRTLWALGIIGGIAGALWAWQFGRTKKEVKEIANEIYQNQIASLVESEISILRTAIKDINEQVKELQAFKNQTIVWVFSGERIEAEPSIEALPEETLPELKALHAIGLHNIHTFAPASADDIFLGDPDLVIFSYDGSEEGKKRLTKIVEILKQQSPPVSLLIYTYNPEKTEIRLLEEERRILEGFLWYLPVNFPTTLIAQAQLLIRTKRTF